jgi:hypothetical protein
MQASTLKLFIGVFFLIIVLSGIAIGANLALKQQKTETSAASPQPITHLPAGEAGYPLPITKKGDLNGDGKIDKLDESLFMLKFRARDKGADIDNSGQVNTLDLALFRNLTQGKK